MYRIIILAPLVALFAALPAAADSSRSGWDSLPAETAFAMRIPDGNAFYGAIHNTRIGRHLFGEERIAEFLEILEREMEEDWQAFRQRLGELELEPKDFPRVLSGESGAALVLEGTEGERPRMYVLFWAEPGEGLGARLLDGLLSTIEDQEGPHRTSRVDFTLAGHEVIHLASPQVVYSYDGQSRVSHNAHTLLNRDGNRIQGALTLMSGPDPDMVRAALTDESIVLPEPETEPGEELRGVFARFLQARDGEAGGFSRTLHTTAGLGEVLPDGVPAFEFALDTQRVVSTVIASSDDENLGRLLHALGVTDLRTTVFRGAVDRGVFRWGGLVSAPAPRRGIVGALMDQPARPAAPAAWVPSHVMDYSHFSLDLGGLFQQIREIAVEIGGDEVAQGFQMVEMQVNSVLETDVASLLSSLGTQHTILTFPVDAATDFSSPEAVAGIFAGRNAMIWSVENEDLWQRIMQTIAAFAPIMGGALQPADEQGFNGWRFEQAGMEGGLFLGDGKLVLGMGRGTVEEVLSALRSPPDGQTALARSQKFREAQTLLDLRSGIYWDIQDVGKQLGDLARIVTGQLQAELFHDGDGPSPRTVEQLVEILDPEIIQEAFGIGVNQAFTTRDGLVFESAQFLAPAEN